MGNPKYILLTGIQISVEIMIVSLLIILTGLSCSKRICQPTLGEICPTQLIANASVSETVTPSVSSSRAPEIIQVLAHFSSEPDLVISDSIKHMTGILGQKIEIDSVRPNNFAMGVLELDGAASVEFSRSFLGDCPQPQLGFSYLDLNEKRGMIQLIVTYQKEKREACRLSLENAKTRGLSLRLINVRLPNGKGVIKSLNLTALLKRL